MSAPSQPVPQRGIVKQIVSGDTIDIRGAPKGGPPPVKRIGLSGITAPKLARKAAQNSDAADTKDEPFAWEAREFLRKKLIGKEVCFIVEYKSNQNREYCTVYLGKDTTGENINEAIVAEGLVEVRRQGKANEQQQRLSELEDAAKTAGKGRWGPGVQEHVRDIKWSVENPRNFIDSFHQQPIKAIVEHVRDGSTLRVLLLPDYYMITLMISGIRCPQIKPEGTDGTPSHEPYGDEAQYFTECRLLQREVEVVLESVSNQNFLGSVLHPNGNIAELLLKEGFARCVDWSMASVSTGAEKLRAAERHAKEKRLRIWKDYTPSSSTIKGKDKEFQGKVMEVVNADALVVKTTEGDIKKIFLSSIRPPRISEEKQSEIQKDSKGRNFRPLYDIPYMYEAREFLRKKLVGKKVNVITDYVQPASQSFPEKTCCTVTIGGINVAEALVSKGLATVVRYRQDDDQRSMHYDELLAAEMKAQKSGKGLHNKKETPVHRVVDLSGDLSKSKQFLPFLKRAEQMDAVVEFVASGSRLRLFIPRENCLITFLLAGISCPRAARTVPGGTIEGEPWGEEALKFTKELCLQREVKVEVESMDKAGNFIGWLFVEGVNLSVALVQEGLATVHFTAERSSHARQLQIAEDSAKQKREKIWSGYEEQQEVDAKDELVERKINHESVIVTEIKPDLTFYVQYVKDGTKLEEAMQQLRQELTSNPPLPGSYTPKKGDLCAAKFDDDEWYRAKVEKVTGNMVQVFYVDYGNRQTTTSSKLAVLPSSYHLLPGAAHEYGLACVQVPQELELAEEAKSAFWQDVENKYLLSNVEYKVGGIEYVTLLSGDNKDDIAKGLIADGLLLVENRKEKRLQKLLAEYKNAQETAKRKRLNLWQYGDFTEDDAKEFGYSKP